MIYAIYTRKSQGWYYYAATNDRAAAYKLMDLLATDGVITLMCKHLFSYKVQNRMKGM